MDQLFLGSLIVLFGGGLEEDLEAERLRFQTDIQQANLQLEDLTVKSSADEQKHFFDELHFSPLKVNILYNLYIGVHVTYPSQDHTLTQCWFNVGPSYTEPTLDLCIVFAGI